jgi:adenosyl cobinamide kinase/adenosyl cobinamide phosphate guanylyltransferase
MIYRKGSKFANYILCVFESSWFLLTKKMIVALDKEVSSQIYSHKFNRDEFWQSNNTFFVLTSIKEQQTCREIIKTS